MNREQFYAAYGEVRRRKGVVKAKEYGLLLAWSCLKSRSCGDWLTDFRPVVILGDVRASSRIRWPNPSLPA